MRACPRMKAVIAALATKHNIDLTQRGAHLRLDLPGYDRLCIEHIGFNRISVAHYFEMNGDLVAEPDIVFFVAPTREWIPITISQSLTGWREYAQLNDDATAVVRYMRHAQQGLAEFAELWADNLCDQGWLEQGVRFRADGEAEDAPF